MFKLVSGFLLAVSFLSCGNPEITKTPESNSTPPTPPGKQVVVAGVIDADHKFNNNYEIVVSGNGQWAYVTTGAGEVYALSASNLYNTIETKATWQKLDLGENGFDNSPGKAKQDCSTRPINFMSPTQNGVMISFPQWGKKSIVKYYEGIQAKLAWFDIDPNNTKQILMGFAYFDETSKQEYAYIFSERDKKFHSSQSSLATVSGIYNSLEREGKNFELKPFLLSGNKKIYVVDSEGVSFSTKTKDQFPVSSAVTPDTSSGKWQFEAATKNNEISTVLSHNNQLFIGLMPAKKNNMGGIAVFDTTTNKLKSLHKDFKNTVIADLTVDHQGIVWASIVVAITDSNGAEIVHTDLVEVKADGSMGRKFSEDLQKSTYSGVPYADIKGKFFANSKFVGDALLLGTNKGLYIFK